MRQQPSFLRTISTEEAHGDVEKRNNSLEQLLDLLLDGNELLTVRKAARRLAKRANVSRIDLVKFDTGSPHVIVTLCKRVNKLRDESTN